MSMLLIAKFEINSIKSVFIELESFMIIKNYLFCSKLDLDASIVITNDSIQRREIRSVDKMIVKLKQLRDYLRDELT